MSPATARLAALAAMLAPLLVVAACIREPFAPLQYAVPVPPPLQPYVEPPLAETVAPAAEPAKPRVTRRKRDRCRCLPAR